MEQPTSDVMAELPSMSDPRADGNDSCNVLGFYYPDRWEPCDNLCKVPYFGNFYEVPGGMTLEAPCDPGREHKFRNAEAAFQALKFWNDAQAFENLSGDGAFKEKLSRKGKETWNYGGFGSNWKGMKAVLEKKFAPGSDLAKKLAATGDAYLLEHNSKAGRDRVWSDNSDGDGTNWLGLQLMVLRDSLSGTGTGSWTVFIYQHIDEATGNPRSSRVEDNLWQKAVKAANKTLAQKLQASPPPAPASPDRRSPPTIQSTGMHRVTHKGLPVNETRSRSSAEVAMLPEGTFVEVVEVAGQSDEGRIRARIRMPEGWISTKMDDESSVYIVKAQANPTICAVPGCMRATFAGTPGYCSITHRNAHPEVTTDGTDGQLLAELNAMTLQNLKKKALELGVGRDKFDEADGQDDPKQAVIELILAKKAYKAPSSPTQVLEQPRPVAPPTQVRKQPRPVSPPTQPTQVREQPRPVSPPVRADDKETPSQQQQTLLGRPLETGSQSNDGNDGNYCTRRKRWCIGSCAVVVVVVILVVVGILKFKVVPDTPAGFSCTDKQRLNHCDTCSAADKCECKKGFHNPSDDQSTCVVDESCSAAQIAAGCIKGSCTTGKCTCSDGYMNPAKDGSTCEKEGECTQKQSNDHCEQGKCVSDTCRCQTTPQPFAHIDGKPAVCEPQGSPCTPGQITAGCAEGFCPNPNYCGCKMGFHHPDWNPATCTVDAHMHQVNEPQPVAATSIIA